MRIPGYIFAIVLLAAALYTMLPVLYRGLMAMIGGL